MSRQRTVKAVAATAPVGGNTADLKNKFTAGSIPLDTDFSELIDIAECGRRAVGQSADQTDNSVGVGFALATDSANIGKLSVLAKPDSGVTVDNTGVGFDQTLIFQKGMIIMYHDNGTHTAPDGWAICNGSNGTPDLTSKFVMGGDWAGETNGKVMSGSNNARQATGSATGANANISNNKTEAYTLTVADIPAHTHEIHDGSNNILKKDSMTCNENGDVGIPAIFNGSSNGTSSVVFQSTGGGGGHSHDITQSVHTHNVTVDIPYYTLMYIMKL